MFALVLKTPPAEVTVTLAEAKAHVRQTFTDASEDAKITRLIAAITAEAEKITHRGFVTQTWTWYDHQFPTCHEIELGMGGIQSVTSVKYYDENGTLITLDPARYQVDLKRDPARITRAVGDALWPTTQCGRVNSVEIEFVCGYGAASAVPEGIKEAILLAVGSLYTNREDEVTGTITERLGRTFETMLYPYRVFNLP